MTTTILITGNTYPVREELKAMGGRWDADAKGWRVPESKAATARGIVAGTSQAATQRRRIVAADLFCGAGGFTEGARRAAERLGLTLEMAACVNHWPVAIETHRRNHPDATHFCADLTTIRPIVAVPSGKLDLLMASPTCTFHSRARGGKPTSDQQRMDPWHVIAWLTELRVKRIIVENVGEFVDWGPIDPRTGRPIKSRKGEYFRAWVAAIEALGFRTDHRIINCAGFGDATTRERFFLIARSDGKRLAWPEPSHVRLAGGDLFAGVRPLWRPARKIIDWSIRGRSIFDRKRPLAPKTLARILAGAQKFAWPEPFLVILRQHMAGQSIDGPLPTITASGTHIGLAQPIIFANRSGSSSRSDDEPFILPQGSNGTAKHVDEPSPSIVTVARVGLVEPCGPWACDACGETFTDSYAASEPGGLSSPECPRCGEEARLSRVEPFVLSPQSCGAPRSIDEPVSGMTTTTCHTLIAPYYGSGSGETCRSTDEPLPTATTKARFGMVMPVTHAGGGNRARDLDQPLATITTAARGELAFVAGEARPNRSYDILFRMLEPHELAAAMSLIDGDRRYAFAGTKTDAIKQIGNAVPARTAAALVEAMVRE